MERTYWDALLNKKLLNDIVIKVGHFLDITIVKLLVSTMHE